MYYEYYHLCIHSYASVTATLQFSYDSLHSSLKIPSWFSHDSLHSSLMIPSQISWFFHGSLTIPLWFFHNSFTVFLRFSSWFPSWFSHDSFTVLSRFLHGSGHHRTTLSPNPYLCPTCIIYLEHIQTGFQAGTIQWSPKMKRKRF